MRGTLWYGSAAVTRPGVLLVLGQSAAWSRGILKGFHAVAQEQDWNLLRYHPATDLAWVSGAWAPAAVVLGPEDGGPWPDALRACIAVSVNADRTAEGVASVCVDEEQVAKVALEHLLARGLTTLTTFRFDEAPFAVARERAFREAAQAEGARLAAAWWEDGVEPSRAHEVPAAIAAWLRDLPRPCGVFACCDPWSRVVARYARAADLRVPEDVSIVGVDNDVVECELGSPPLSSVAVPWQGMGRHAAELVRLALSGQAIAGKRVVVGPGPVMARRSSDVLAIEDALVARAVRWIRERSHGVLTVAAVARAAGTSRRRLERRFHGVLGRTVAQEIRRARVETARRFLCTTRHELAQIASLSGFKSATLLNLAFRRELGLPPGAYRCQFREALADDD